jgi:hypothetical protein
MIFIPFQFKKIKLSLKFLFCYLRNIWNFFLSTYQYELYLLFTVLCVVPTLFYLCSFELIQYKVLCIGWLPEPEFLNLPAV